MKCINLININIDVAATVQGGIIIINRDYREEYNNVRSREYYDFTEEVIAVVCPTF